MLIRTIKMIKKIKKNNSEKAGFTLIELLVVIAIIGILLSFAAASFSTSQKRGRDVKRKSDIQSIQKGLEQAYALNEGFYPVLADMDALISAVSSSTDFDDIFPGGVPSDPRPDSTSGYFYTLESDASAFCVCARMESDTSVAGGNATTVANSTACNYTQTAADSYFYCLSNLQ